MPLTPEEMFYLATGLSDLTSWVASAKFEQMRHSKWIPAERKVGQEEAVSLFRKVQQSRSSEKNTLRSMTSHGKIRSSASSLTAKLTGLVQLAATAMQILKSSTAANTSSAFANRSGWRTFGATLIVILFAFNLQTVDGCSSRSTPKPRPPPSSPSPTAAVRPNITFQTYACPPAYATYYCLNGATCFTIKIGESILYNCECSDGFMGQRCEYKDLDGSYLPLREKIMLERASIAGGATVAVVLVVIILVIFYTYIRQRRKEQRLSTDFKENYINAKAALKVAVVHDIRQQHHRYSIKVDDDGKNNLTSRMEYCLRSTETLLKSPRPGASFTKNTSLLNKAGQYSSDGLSVCHVLKDALSGNVRNPVPMEPAVFTQLYNERLE